VATTFERVRTQQLDDMSIYLRYAGTDVNDGTMDVYTAAAGMVAFSDYVMVAAKQVFGPTAEVQAKVTSFRPGSFETDFLFKILGAAATLWTSHPDFPKFIELIKESLELFKFLRKEPPRAVEYHGDRQAVTVTNNSGDVRMVNINSLNVTLNPAAGAAAKGFLADILERNGIDSVEIASEDRPLLEASKEDAPNFAPIAPEEKVTETVVSMVLTVETASFVPGKKWRLYDGAQTITADIADPVFRAAIEAGEPFRQGDVLHCRVRLVQTRVGSRLKLDRTIVEVVRHEQRFGEQTELFKTGPSVE